MHRFLQYRLLLILAAVVFLADQVTKLWIHNNLPYGTFFSPDRIDVISGFFHIVYVGNTGAAWSMFSEHTWALTLVGFIALAAIFFFRRQLELEKRATQLSFGLMIGGIIGNLIDRVRLGYVIDFLDFQFGDYHFPSFNVADSAITVGVTLYLIFSVFEKRPTPERE